MAGSRIRPLPDEWTRGGRQAATRRHEEAAGANEFRPPAAQPLPCTPTASVLANGSLCLLLATSTSHVSSHFAALNASLTQLVERHEWTRVALNLYLRGADKSLASLALHPHVTAYAVAGFKSLFWKRVLTPRAVAAFTHVFLFDDDMRVAPGEFQLVALLRLQERLSATTRNLYALSTPTLPPLHHTTLTAKPPSLPSTRSATTPSPPLPSPSPPHSPSHGSRLCALVRLAAGARQRLADRAVANRHRPRPAEGRPHPRQRHAAVVQDARDGRRALRAALAHDGGAQGAAVCRAAWA